MSAPYTYTSFANGVAALTVTGVKRKQPNIPDTVNSAAIPLQFVRLPEGTEGPLTADGEGGWPNRTVELVIIASPIGQSRQPTNQALVLTLIDNLVAALRAVAATNTIAQSKLSWEIRGEIDFVGDTEYWLVVARITGNG